MPDLNCIGCGATVDCPDIPFSELYSLENPTFSFVLDCPDNNCQFGPIIYFACCDRLLQAPVPVGSSSGQIELILQSLASQCFILQSACGELPTFPPGGGPTPNNPIHIFFNHAQTCSAICADGNEFDYTVPAGWLAAATQAKADSAAYALACQKSKAARFCLSDLKPTLACEGQAYSGTLSASGALVLPCAWSIISGALPGGLSIGGTAQFGTITGTPTASGTFSFTAQCTGNDGLRVSKAYSMCVSDLTPHTLSNATLGTPYSVTITDTTGCFGSPIVWSLSSGSLPTGLSLAPTTGIINGTPTVNGSSSFSITGTGPLGACQRAYTLVVGIPNVCITNATDWATLQTSYTGIGVTIGNTTFPFAGGPPNQWCNNSAGCITEVVDNTGGNVAWLPFTWCLVVGDAFPGFGNKATVYTRGTGPNGHYTFNSRGPASPAGPPAAFDVVDC